MKKILFTANSLNIGGLEKALVLLLNNLKDEYDITLVLENYNGYYKELLDSKIRVQEYIVSRCKIPLVRKIINLCKRIKWSLKNYHKYDFSCSYATYSLIGSRLALIASTNSSLYVHSNYAAYFNHDELDIKNFFEDLHYKKFKNLIFVSNESRDSLQKVLDFNAKNMHVINNLTDSLSIIKSSLEECDLGMFKKENINLLFVGRIDNTSKNFDLLLKALKNVKTPNIKLFIIGDGDYKKNIIKLVADLKLNDRVTLLGEKTNPYPYMKKSDALILTSKYEGFPLIYNEALVLNKKMITTVPVSDNYIDIKNYFTCVKQDCIDIAKKIEEVTKTDVFYNVDFMELNKKNLDKLKNIIERNGESNENK